MQCNTDTAFMKRKQNLHTYYFGHFGYCRASHGPFFGYFETILDIQKRLAAEDDEVRARIFQKYIRVSWSH